MRLIHEWQHVSPIRFAESRIRRRELLFIHSAEF